MGSQRSPPSGETFKFRKVLHNYDLTNLCLLKSLTLAVWRMFRITDSKQICRGFKAHKAVYQTQKSACLVVHITLSCCIKTEAHLSFTFWEFWKSQPWLLDGWNPGTILTCVCVCVCRWASSAWRSMLKTIPVSLCCRVVAQPNVLPCKLQTQTLNRSGFSISLSY